MQMHTITRICAVALLVAVGRELATAQKLSPTEEKMVATINAQSAEFTAFLEQLVNVNSGTMNSAGVRRIAAMLAPRFCNLGFTVRWAPTEPEHGASTPQLSYD